MGACACGAVLTTFVLHIHAGRRHAARTALAVLTSVGVAGGGGGGSFVFSASKIGTIASASKIEIVPTAPPLATALLEVVHGAPFVGLDASACVQ